MDITMCMNEECLARNMCHRYTAEPSDYQAYMDFQPKDGEERCEHFWPNEKQNGTKELSEKNSKRRAWHH